jgi:CRP/FNR family transcriptional regulator, anaerobic regulatory protein
MDTTVAVRGTTLPRRTGVAHAVTMPSDLGYPGLPCGHCGLRPQCIGGEALEAMHEAAEGQRRVRRGEALYQAGDPFRSLYAVRFGFFKSYVVSADGRSQITAFGMASDILGIDGIGTGAHAQSVVALEDSEVCVFPYARLESAATRVPALRRQLQRLMSCEIVRTHGLMMLLGTMRAEERVAAFLLDLSERYLARGYAGGEFNLRMSREEIGSYLGLKLETVSRLMSRLQEAGVITALSRYVRILDKPALGELAGRPPSEAVSRRRKSRSSLATLPALAARNRVPVPAV